MPAQPLSPLDGRYQRQVAGLSEHLSEAGLNRARVHVEVEWLIHLTDQSVLPGTSPLTADQKSALRRIVTGFDADSIKELAETEAITVHEAWVPRSVARWSSGAGYTVSRLPSRSRVTVSCRSSCGYRYRTGFSLSPSRQVTIS